MIHINTTYRIKTLEELAKEYDIRVLADNEGVYYAIGNLTTIRDTSLFGEVVIVTAFHIIGFPEVDVKFVNEREGEWSFPAEMLVPTISVGGGNRIKIII